ncbi:MAG TPA: cell envelope integrity protein CreD [Burkholderiales bacterium]|nr:cell envelope integrity protein CreD [Burkholderiales bacterium]
MKNPLLLKALAVGVLALLLMIPAAMIRELVAERQKRAAEAVDGIAEGWGKRQAISGPYLLLPYDRSWTDVKHEWHDGKQREIRVERTEAGTLRLPAADVEWSIVAEVTEKSRSLFKARLYSARLQARGSVPLAQRTAREDGISRYKWGAPRLVVGIADPNGIRAAGGVKIGAGTHRFLPGANDGEGTAGLHSELQSLAGAEAADVPFEFSLELGGTESLAVAPLGADMTVAMRADWPHPSFLGRFLPARHQIDASGFSATWRISRFASQAKDQLVVSFVEPAGLYQRLERSAKYAFLFIGLTFAAFYLFELVRRIVIHPIQYGLVGLALAMFFLLLTALSEHIAFELAYAAAALACVILISAYLNFILKSAKAATAFGAALSAVYGILYLLLQAEDYSLLGGTLFLFALLAAVMLGTRRVDWYGLSRRADGSAQAGRAS